MNVGEDDKEVRVVEGFGAFRWSKLVSGAVIKDSGISGSEEDRQREPRLLRLNATMVSGQQVAFPVCQVKACSQ